MKQDFTAILELIPDKEKADVEKLLKKNQVIRFKDVKQKKADNLLQLELAFQACIFTGALK